MADDVIIQAQSTLFDRQGVTRQSKGYVLVDPTWSNINLVAAQAQVPTLSIGYQQAALARLLVQNQQEIPGGLTLLETHSIDPDLFNGAGELQNIYEISPFSTEYELETQALYVRSYAIARAAAQTGEASIRGGTARVAFELAELDTRLSINRFREIWQAQLAAASLVLQAVQSANAIEAERRQSKLRAQQQQSATEQGRAVQTLGAAEQLTRDREHNLRTLAASAEFLGLPNMVTTEAIQGEGFQSGVTTSFGNSYWR